MKQLTIFDFIKDDEELLFFQKGAMYAKLPKERITNEAVELADKMIYPGQFVYKLGEKKRTSFEMQEGSYLRFVGKTDDLILFSVNDLESDFYYAFAYVDKNTLLICSNSGCRDIRIKKIDIFDSYYS